LSVIGEAAAGKPWDQPLTAGQAVRIFTGGVIPNGADAVVIQENTTRDGNTVIVNEASRSNRNIRAAGIDFREGDLLLPAGRRLSDRNLSLAANMNYPQLPVRRRPRVAVLATGDELLLPGSTPGPGQIILSNGFALRALAQSEGADTNDLGIAADILITTGGASVGDHDLMHSALDAEGVAMAFWKIALRPGKPMMHGRLGAMRVIGLPGNPVSSYVCAFLFMVPLIRALSGRSDVHHAVEHAIPARDLAANDHRQDYLRARLDIREDGVTVATPVNHQDSSLTANLSAAQGLVVRPPHAPAAPAGSSCPFIRLPN
jgi:molybdopterin molybdotransferase